MHTIMIFFLVLHHSGGVGGKPMANWAGAHEIPHATNLACVRVCTEESQFEGQFELRKGD